MSEPIFICADCGHLGPPDVTECVGDLYEAYGVEFRAPEYAEVCGDCGSEAIDIAAACTTCHERLALAGFDGCAECELRFAASDGDTDHESLVRRAMDDLDTTIRDIVRCQAVAR